jgi:hypothetical protein
MFLRCGIWRAIIRFQAWRIAMLMLRSRETPYISSISFSLIFFMRKCGFAIDIDKNHCLFIWTIPWIVIIGRSLYNYSTRSLNTFPPTWFARSKPLWLLSLWNVEAQNEGPAVSDDWRPWQWFEKTWHSKTFILSLSTGWNVLIESLSTRESTVLNHNKRSFESLPLREMTRGSGTICTLVRPYDKAEERQFEQLSADLIIQWQSRSGNSRAVWLQGKAARPRSTDSSPADSNWPFREGCSDAMPHFNCWSRHGQGICIQLCESKSRSECHISAASFGSLNSSILDKSDSLSICDWC